MRRIATANRPLFALTVFLFMFVATGCRATPERAQVPEAQVEEEPRPLYMRYVVMPENPRPGYPMTIGVRYGLGVEYASLMVGDRRLGRATFFQVSSEDGDTSFSATLLTVPTTINVDQAVIVLETSDGPAAEIPLKIAPREFTSETIQLNQAMANIQADISPERTAQAQHLWAVLGRVGTEAYFFDNFVRPVESTRRTSLFAARRIFVNVDGRRSTSIHAGIDYGVPTGTPVFATGGGRIVLARDRIVSGKSVIIEHLPGVFSIYYHLDSIVVVEGNMIEAGDVLGLSGATGFATGPHLHWEVRVFGENTDPDALVARPLLDRNAILSKLGY
ncbi:MAG: M23 family metallopeptidase [Treponema sp.]|nr:M23 family metallopeptidase [Treponema sp.]